MTDRLAELLREAAALAPGFDAEDIERRVLAGRRRQRLALAGTGLSVVVAVLALVVAKDATDSTLRTLNDSSSATTASTVDADPGSEPDSAPTSPSAAPDGEDRDPNDANDPNDFEPDDADAPWAALNGQHLVALTGEAVSVRPATGGVARTTPVTATELIGSARGRVVVLDGMDVTVVDPLVGEAVAGGRYAGAGAVHAGGFWAADPPERGLLGPPDSLRWTRRGWDGAAIGPTVELPASALPFGSVGDDGLAAVVRETGRIVLAMPGTARDLGRGLPLATSGATVAFLDDGVVKVATAAGDVRTVADLGEVVPAQTIGAAAFDPAGEHLAVVWKRDESAPTTSLTVLAISGGARPVELDLEDRYQTVSWSPAGGAVMVSDGASPLAVNTGTGALRPLGGGTERTVFLTG